jgi:hypothetical protein
MASTKIPQKDLWGTILYHLVHSEQPTRTASLLNNKVTMTTRTASLMSLLPLAPQSGQCAPFQVPKQYKHYKSSYAGGAGCTALR